MQAEQGTKREDCAARKHKRDGKTSEAQSAISPEGSIEQPEQEAETKRNANIKGDQSNPAGPLGPGTLNKINAKHRQNKNDI